MGRYIEWDDCVERYPELDTYGGSDELEQTHIMYAESFIDSMLQSHFTVPFSSNNITARDLTINNVYYRVGKFKIDNAESVWSETLGYIAMLKNGQASMVSSDGSTIELSGGGAVYSNTQSYHTSFGMDEVIDWGIDVDHATDDFDAR